MIKLVLIRHGESLWNKENRFTGWQDVDLTTYGEQQARAAGRMLRKEGYVFDMAYTSLLKRAICTLNIVLDEIDQSWIPVVKDWHWNERHYGALEGLDKAETAKEYGEEQVHTWRRSYDVPPPPLDKSDERYPGNDRRYKHLKESEIPLTESLEMTVSRLKPMLEGVIFQRLRDGNRLVITAHGNSLRAIIKIIEQMSDEEIVHVNVPTGVPLVYELDQELHPVKSYYLGENEEGKCASSNKSRS